MADRYLAPLIGGLPIGHERVGGSTAMEKKWTRVVHPDRMSWSLLDPDDNGACLPTSLLWLSVLQAPYIPVQPAPDTAQSSRESTTSYIQGLGSVLGDIRWCSRGNYCLWFKDRVPCLRL